MSLAPSASVDLALCTEQHGKPSAGAKLQRHTLTHHPQGFGMGATERPPPVLTWPTSLSVPSPESRLAAAAARSSRALLPCSLDTTKAVPPPPSPLEKRARSRDHQDSPSAAPDAADATGAAGQGLASALEEPRLHQRRATLQQRRVPGRAVRGPGLEVPGQAEADRPGAAHARQPVDATRDVSASERLAISLREVVAILEDQGVRIAVKLWPKSIQHRPCHSRGFDGADDYGLPKVAVGS
eukprot:CAMPEP_0183403470 /NCGR_PEP_ID=MMETSP0370-20130417/14599_1 /TAXON_ID=268820 /ORGANISM="Peridinium aciculiferum, Strain PAER-2" /LENGTH=240 /DNA_ID=CAMNT_0025585227 /DNA_START=91 /DNA_END=812 /DNA_ORIENTATION=+